MSHLGERVAPLVDGQLTPEQAERAYIHLTGCRPCRDSVELERLTKQRLAALCPPAPSDALMQQLMGLSGPSGPLPPRAGHVPGSPRPQFVQTAPKPVAALGVRERPPGRRGAVRPSFSAAPSRATTLSRVARVSRASRTRVAVAMVGAVCLVGAGVAGGVANAGQGSITGPEITPALTSFVGEHVATTSNLPFSDQSISWGMVGAGR